jgi:hypothetical protein
VKSELTSALALLAGVLLAGFLALTVRFLPLLSGLLAATLLLAGLLTRVLVLLTLTRGLILAGHSGSPFVGPSPKQPPNARFGSGGIRVPPQLLHGVALSIPCRFVGADLVAGTRAKTTLYNLRWPKRRLLPGPVPTC